MPKRSAARASAQRAKTRSQKSFELVMPASAAPAAPVESDEASQEVQDAQNVQDTPAQEAASAKLSKASLVADGGKAKAVTVEKPISVETKKGEPRGTASKSSEEAEDEGAVAIVDLPKGGSAAARLAARRSAAQRNAQRSNALITPEHYQYVRHDLMLIAILAIIMFAVIIGLHFVPGIGY